MFSEDQDEVQFYFDDSVPLGDAPTDWTLPSVSIIQLRCGYNQRSLTTISPFLLLIYLVCTDPLSRQAVDFVCFRLRYDLACVSRNPRNFSGLFRVP